MLSAPCFGGLGSSGVKVTNHLHMLLLCVAAGTLLGSGPGCVVRYSDYPVEFDAEEVAERYEGEPSLVAGTYEEQLFRELEEGAPLHVIHGFQGGTWVHLSVRVNGMPRSGEIAVSLNAQGGAEVGRVSYGIELVRAAEGFLEAYDVPVPLPDDDVFLDDLMGQRGTLAVTYHAGGEQVSTTVGVVFREGLGS